MSSPRFLQKAYFFSILGAPSVGSPICSLSTKLIPLPGAFGFLPEDSTDDP